VTAVLPMSEHTHPLPVIDGRRVDPPERSQFDFWLGSWRVRQLVGSEVDGRNEVSWVLDGTVLWEQFSAGRDPFTGWSFSVPVADRGWVQTWVDNTGTYLDFVGGWCGDRMILERSTGTPSPTLQRMTWHGFTDRGFVWDWAARPHPGAEWDLVWQLRYERPRRRPAAVQ
jgi:hypothetical protein